VAFDLTATGTTRADHPPVSLGLSRRSARVFSVATPIPPEPPVSSLFTEFVSWPDRDEVMLAELTPGLTLSGFTAVGGGAPNTYQLSLSRLTQTSQVPGGFYRKVVGVRENGVDLTARSSLSAVDAAAGSWYWDESAGLLYVRSTGGGDPDTYTAYQALVTFYVATAPIIMNISAGNAATGRYYHPWMTGTVPAWVQTATDLIQPQKSTPPGELELTNGHEAWNTLIAPEGEYTWKNKKVRFFLGGSWNGIRLEYSDFVNVMTMLVDDVAADEHTCTFQLKPLERQTELQLPITPYFESSYPNLGDGVRGTMKPIVYGRNVYRADLTDASGLGVWTLADASVQTLSALYAVNAVDKTTGVRHGINEGTQYTKNLTTCTVTIIDPIYTWQNFDLEVEVAGVPGGVRGYLSTFSEIVQDMLTRFLGVQAADLDAAAFAQAALDAPEELALVLKERRSIGSIFATDEPDRASLEASVLGTVQQTLTGRWTCWIWKPEFDSSTAVSLRKEDFKLFKPQPRLETIYSAVAVAFNQNYARQEWPVEQATSPRVQYLTESRERLNRYTFLRAASDAQVLAQRVLFVAGAVATEVEFEESGAKLASKTCQDRVLITFDPAPSATGAYVSRPFEILQLRKGYSPELSVAGRFSDLNGVGMSIGEWTDAGAPNWASASAAQRLSQGFWTDANGQADSGDASTKNVSRWW
jgi:hypothetical protein